MIYFGGKAFPYIAFQGQMRISECCEGDKHDETTPFQWGRTKYDPSLPRLLILCKDGELATRTRTYVYLDDIHLAARGKALASSGTKRMASQMNSRENQESAKKRRIDSLAPGAWRGWILLHAIATPHTQ